MNAQGFFPWAFFILAARSSHQQHASLRKRQIDKCHAHGNRQSEPNFGNRKKWREGPKLVQRQKNRELCKLLRLEAAAEKR
jgi:hypothetical protein